MINIEVTMPNQIVYSEDATPPPPIRTISEETMGCLLVTNLPGGGGEVARENHQIIHSPPRFEIMMHTKLRPRGRIGQSSRQKKQEVKS